MKAYYSLSADQLAQGARIPLMRLNESGEVFYELALAMEARGYRIGARRTRLREEPVTAADWGALLLALAALAAVIYFRL